MSLAQKLTTLGENMPRVFDAGVGYVFRHLRYVAGVFYKAAFPSGSELTVEMPDSPENLMEMFRLVSGLRKLRLVLPGDRLYRLSYLVYYSSVEEVELPEGLRIKDFSYFACRCENLKRVVGTLNLSESTNNDNCFSGCPALEEVRFVPGSILRSLNLQNSDRLSAESVASLLAGLGEVSQQQTLMLHKTVRAALGDAQLQTLADKNWQVA